MRKKIWRFIAAIDGISGFFLFFAAFLCLALVLTTCQQVVSRYVWGVSSIALQELQWHLFGTIFLLAAAGALREGMHVRVDIFYSKFNQSAQNWIDAVGIVLALLPSCVVLVCYGIGYVEQAMTLPGVVSSVEVFSSLVAGDHRLFQLMREIDENLQRTLFIGETSPNPGGLPARWVVKAMIPLGSILLFMQGSAELLKIFSRYSSSN